MKRAEELNHKEILSSIIKLGLVNKTKAIALFKTKVDHFKDNHCKQSIYLFKKTNKLRIKAIRLVRHRFFERTILGLIIISSVKPAIDTYQDSSSKVVFDVLDILFTLSFTFEALLKIIAFGFVTDKGSYLRDAWNVLDFLIVFASILDLLVSSIDIPVLKILRLIRTLRPLRFISHNTEMKVLVSALIESIGSIINVLVVVLVVWLMFAIVGVSLFSGRFYYCTENTYVIDNERECDIARGYWLVRDSNFDNIV